MPGTGEEGQQDIKLYQGDCLEVMKDIPDNSVDMVLTDPPYGTTACKWDSIIPLEPMWKQLKRIISLNRVIVLFGSEPFSSMLRMSNIEGFKYDWYWKKSNVTGFQHAKNAPLRLIEVASVFSEGVVNHSSLTKKRMIYKPQGIVKSSMKRVGKKPEYMGQRPNQEGKEYISFKNFPRHLIYFANDSKVTHPTQKPVALMEYLIKTYTNEGEVVLDFTMGSGTTGVAAKKLKRKFIGIELDPEYFDIASRRIAGEYIETAREKSQPKPLSMAEMIKRRSQ